MKKTMWLAAAQLCASFSAEVQTVRRKWIFMVMLVCMLAVAGCKTDGEDRTAAPTENLPEETPLENEEVTPEETLPEETTLEATTPEAATPEETTLEETTKAVVFTDVEETVYCTADSLNVRNAPGTYGEKVGLLKLRDEVKRTGVGDNGWSRIMFNGNVCYVSGEYLSTEKPKEPETNISVEGIPGTGILHQGTNGILVAIDPGHQLKGSSTKEPNGPGATEMKARVTSGTTGVSTGIYEYVMNLIVSLQLRDALLAEGYSVLMIRETHAVDISNAERAVLANNAGADIFLRIHCNGASNQNAKGTVTYAPSKNNPYCGEIVADSQRLSKFLVDAMCAETGFKNRGVATSDTMTGINWCEVPVSIVEMGFMSNPQEDEAMAKPEVQAQLVRGMVKGVNAYFGR